MVGGGTGLDLAWPALRLSLEADGEADYGVELVAPARADGQGRAEGDSFLRALVGGADLEIEFDLGLGWSRSAASRSAGRPRSSAASR